MLPISDSSLLSAGLICFTVVCAFVEFRRRSRHKAQYKSHTRPQRQFSTAERLHWHKGKTVVVDGSNVMHWSGEPSKGALWGVISTLTRQGLNPYVIFDANVGHILSGRHLDLVELSQICGLPKERIAVVDKGVVADEVILKYARSDFVKVVSNDRYRDWTVKFPFVKTKGRMMRGTWKGGAVVWDKK